MKKAHANLRDQGVDVTDEDIGFAWYSMQISKEFTGPYLRTSIYGLDGQDYRFEGSFDGQEFNVKDE